MRAFIVTILLLVSSSCLFPQAVTTTNDLEDIVGNLLLADDSVKTEILSDMIDPIKQKIDSLKNSPEFYEKVWGFLIRRINMKDSTLGIWLNALNLDFKTFMSQDSSVTSLGLAYDLTLERARIIEKGGRKNGRSIALESKGNIAFNKELNPSDFLSTRISIGLFNSGGGVLLKDMANILDTLQNLRLTMANYQTAEEILESPEWKRFNELFYLKNSWLLKYDLNGGLESNQDFTRKQYTLGLRLGASVKSWNTDNALSWMNILDYPFALTRLITGYDKEFSPSGATIPTLMAGFDFIYPVGDSIRQKADQELNPFPRINLELGFRTVLGRAGSQILFVNCSLKYFTEPGASQAVKDLDLDSFLYFTSSLTASNGLFVSYTYGQLPFDRAADAVYQLGFRYAF